ncbi:MAG: hypothetical protein QOJ95_1344 [Mycobacterium sp.]|nr:hypothetical protein [Mycobacterium sp.]
MAADQRSALPHVPGIPWWAAAIVAVTLTAIGVAYDAGSGTNALGGVFAVFYVLGCLAAVVAVRQSGVFTAVIQPPLILFVAVPFAYFVFHGSTFTGIKDTLINCGYPLIERFPLMFFTSATVLLIGMVRWYLGVAARRISPKDVETSVDAPDETAAAKPAAADTKTRRSTRSTKARAAGATAAASAAAAAPAMDDEAPRPPRRSSRAAATGSQRSTGAAAGSGSRRARHSRPPETEIIDAVPPRPRKRNAPPVDSPAEPRRRPRSGEAREPREPRERRPLPPLDRRASARDRTEREPYERPQRRERPEGYERAERPQRRPRSTDYEPYEPPPSRTNGSGTHHPVSRVRYRGTDDGESRTEHRTRPRRPRHSAPDSWEYDA